MIIFIGGSISIPFLSEEARKLINEKIENGDKIIVGDASGVDKAVQSYLYDKGYQNVEVYVAGQKVRCNIGGWKVNHIEAPPNCFGANFYAVKDKAMAKVADEGIMIWDGKSEGTWNNVLNLTRENKKVSLYWGSKNIVIILNNEQELNGFLYKYL